ncbi:MAG: zinc ABC transporter substrate-binding protein [Desulfohalobiaceae bacterium]|nr:zinc ABC transporter substrate-binding protein [Desulfohalobiaceae bacterium]
MARAWRAVFFLGLALVLLVGPASGTQAGEDKLRLAASIPPQHYFLKRIGGERVEVEILLPPGANPVTYEPKPSLLRHISRVQAYFRIGIPVESAWLQRLRGINPDMQIVSMYKGIQRRPMPSSYEEALEPGDSSYGESGEGHPDPHIWLAPPLARIMAQNTRDELIRTDPEHADLYRANFAELVRDINELDLELLDLFAKAENRSFLAYHPAWGYFARAYGLNQIPVKLAGKKLTAKRMHHLMGIAREKGLRTVFVQPQFSRRPARQVAENLEGKVRDLDPLAEDWAANLRECARRIRLALE